MTQNDAVPVYSYTIVLHTEITAADLVFLINALDSQINKIFSSHSESCQNRVVLH